MKTVKITQDSSPKSKDGLPAVESMFTQDIIKEGQAAEEEKKKFNFCYAYYSLFVLIGLQVAGNWARTIISPIYSFSGDVPKNETSFYSMVTAVEYLDADEYGKLNGLWYSITFAPSVLFVGYLTEQANRTNMLGMSVLVAGMITFANAYVDYIKNPHW